MKRDKNPHKSDTAFIIPMYNEGTVIKDVINSVLKHYDYVVCVDDGSSDNTIEEVSKTKAILVKHPINMGQGASLQTGVEFARENLDVEYFVHFDADGQHGLDDVASMLQEIETDKYDIILGSRFLGKTVGMSKSKGYILKLAILFSNSLSGLKLTDTHNGLRVFNRHVAETMTITMPDMAHASEILEIIADQKYRYKEIPVTISYTDYSRAKGQTIINAINIGLDIMMRKFLK